LKTILVTGATGTNRSEIMKRLADSVAGARPMVRKFPDGGTDVLPGAEFVTADFDDPASIRRAGRSGPRIPRYQGLTGR
jgi:uncharacterized protein YbjT (DUF2867 family)